MGTCLLWSIYTMISGSPFPTSTSRSQLCPAWYTALCIFQIYRIPIELLHFSTKKFAIIIVFLPFCLKCQRKTSSLSSYHVQMNWPFNCRGLLDAMIVLWLHMINEFNLYTLKNTGSIMHRLKKNNPFSDPFLRKIQNILRYLLASKCKQEGERE